MYELIDTSLSCKWKEICARYSCNSILYQPEYIKLWEINNDGKGFLFFYKSSNGVVFYPFLIKSLNDLKFLYDTQLKNYSDIITPYGYGGPLLKPNSNSNFNSLLREFREAFSVFCEENRIISEFIRFHPLLENHKFLENYINVNLSNYIVYVDLQVSEEQIWKNYEYNNQKNIKKALRNEIEIIVDKDFKYLDDFMEIYYLTMDRTNAKDYYFFKREFFEFIKLNLKDNVILFFAKKDNKIISTELAFYDDNIIYSFLGGTLSEYFPLRPNNILKHQLILWAKKRNIKYYLIGGGVSINDGLFEYKRSFSKNGIKPFFIGKKIHNIEKYKLIEEQFKEYILKINPIVNISEINYFPIYRFKP